MNATQRKPVYEDGQVIGDAVTWGDVVALLVLRGMSERRAQGAVMTRGVEGPRGFHIITARAVEQMMEDVRAARQSA